MSVTEKQEIRLTSTYRIKRAKRIKRTLIAVGILIPILLAASCTVLGLRGRGYRAEMADLQDQITRLQQDLFNTEEQLRDMEKAVPAEGAENPAGNEENNANSGVTASVSDSSGANGTGTTDQGNTTNPQPENPADGQYLNVYLTFDDGPSSRTDTILNILELHHIKATFFVLGKPEDKYDLLYKRIVEEGHTLGMHSYSHNYSQIYASEDAFTADLDKLAAFLYDKTGVESRFYRFPGGSSNTVSRTNMDRFFEILEERDITYFDWNVDSYDSRQGSVSADTIVNNVMRGVAKCEGTCIILMHDTDEKASTVQALPRVIEKLEAMGNVRFMPITEETPLIQHRTKNE
ncbi:MAG: polysaccharide deacetylase family protein [Lachnospiraceae bacterium]|nr:polysaccharide deacetylase family protein [Lachnospiraceae bacterium]